jgi:hypothetical protein
MYTILKVTYVFASTTPRTVMFTLVFSRDGPVSGFSLHVHERQPSALWVVGSDSSVTFIFLHVQELQALCVMVYRLAGAGGSTIN